MNCPYCEGNGFITAEGPQPFKFICSFCNGTGETCPDNTEDKDKNMVLRYLKMKEVRKWGYSRGGTMNNVTITILCILLAFSGGIALGMGIISLLNTIPEVKLENGQLYWRTEGKGVACIKCNGKLQWTTCLTFTPLDCNKGIPIPATKSKVQWKEK